MAISNLSDLRERLDRERYDSDPGAFLAEYTSDDNRLMQLAKTEGTQAANRRGMLNSSMAAGASMDAMARTALPLAQQRSQQMEDRNTREEAALFQTNQQERGFGFEQQLSQQAFEQQGQLSAQEASQQGELMEREYGQRGQLSAQEAAQEGRLQESRLATERQLSQLDADTRTTLMNMEESMRLKLADLETTREQKQDATNMLTSFTQQYQESMRSILSNTELGAEERNALLRNAGTLMTKQTDMVRELYDVDISWNETTYDPVDDVPNSGGGSTGSTGSTGTGTGSTGSGGSSGGTTPNTNPDRGGGR